MTPLTPQQEATRIYAEAYDRLADLAQEAKPAKPLRARILAHRALIALRAFRAESRPPGPMRPSSSKVCCSDCLVYMALPGEAKPVPLVEVFV